MPELRWGTVVRLILGTPWPLLSEPDVAGRDFPLHLVLAVNPAAPFGRAVDSSVRRNKIVELRRRGVSVLDVGGNGLPSATGIGIRVLVPREQVWPGRQQVPRGSEAALVNGVDEDVFVVVREHLAVLPRRSLLPHDCGYEVLATEDVVCRHL